MNPGQSCSTTANNNIYYMMVDGTHNFFYNLLKCLCGFNCFARDSFFNISSTLSGKTKKYLLWEKAKYGI